MGWIELGQDRTGLSPSRFARAFGVFIGLLFFIFFLESLAVAATFHTNICMFERKRRDVTRRTIGEKEKGTKNKCHHPPPFHCTVTG
ncbi:uncharacterized protein J3D65DRAFT_627224 [Phyllosticta citribraziliensis]|uniref:Uncharacterized protein n=1 Tax=Phyllosticta citribraziliensis TaxID=989973 RepID=A0ABR1LLH7_9PEZI